MEKPVSMRIQIIDNQDSVLSYIQHKHTTHLNYRCSYHHFIFVIRTPYHASLFYPSMILDFHLHDTMKGTTNLIISHPMSVYGLDDIIVSFTHQQQTIVTKECPQIIFSIAPKDLFVCFLVLWKVIDILIFHL